MRKYDEYLVTIDTIYPDRYERETAFYVATDLQPEASMTVRSGVIAGLIDSVKNAVARRAGRSALLDMDESQLRDIGLTRIAAQREAGKSWFLD